MLRTPILLLALLVAAGCARPQSGSSLRAINGTELYVRMIGSGEPVIVVHGGPMLEHGYLADHLNPLADSYRLIFYDQRLNGRSSAYSDSSEVTLANFVADIEGVRASIGAEQVHVVGHSWGGLLAGLYAATHPDRLLSLVLLNPMPPTAEIWQEEETALSERMTPEWRSDADSIRALPGFVRREQAEMQSIMRVSFRSQMADPAASNRLSFWFPEGYDARAQTLSILMGELLNYDIRESFSRIPPPALVVYGDAEPAASLSAPVYAAAMTGARHLIIPGSGHFPFVEQPELLFAAMKQTMERE